MDINGLSMLWYRRSKPTGKVRRRLQHMKSTTSPVVTLPDLSHNESIRLATDALLDRGLRAYQEVLAREGEVDFLSGEEKGYILENARDLSGSGGVRETEEGEEQGEGTGSTPSSQSFESQNQSCCPQVSESETLGPEQGQLAAGWGHRMPIVEVFFQSDRAASMKDLLREFISKATKVVAIVMDIFSDVEIFCDILEATRKRGVSVYLLLDYLNLHLFEKMCEDLHISSKHLTKMSVRSVQGKTYCAKSGRKFTGQIKEKFIIIDSTEVLAGSYSFTWLSWQVHRSLAMLFKGSAVQPFHLEFQQLYACSQPMPDFLSVTDLPRLSPPLFHLQEHLTTQPIPTATPTLHAQPRHHLPQPPVQPVSLELGLGIQRGYMAPQELRWTPPRHVTLNRLVVAQQSLACDHGASHLPWRLPNSNSRTLGGTVGLLDRHPLLKTGLWLTAPK